MRDAVDFWLATAALTDMCFELDDYEKSFCH